MALTFITAKTEAETTPAVNIDGDKIGATIIAHGLSSGEEIGIEITGDDGTTWEQVRVGGSDFKVTYETPHTLTISGRATIRFVKPLTTNPVSVHLAVKDNV